MKATLLAATLVLALCSGAAGQVKAPASIKRNVLPAVKAIPTPADICVANTPSCQICAKNAAGKFVCTVCKAYAPRVTTPYDDGAGNLINEPYCNGVCMHYKRFGKVLESDGTSPCVNCTETGGCSVCKPQSFKTPDTYSMTAFKLPSMPIQCETCGPCMLGRCSNTAGCLTCDVDASNKPYPKMKMVSVAPNLPDLDVCITNLCSDQDYSYEAGTNVDTAPRIILPENGNLYSYALNCKRKLDPSYLTIMQCSNQLGCTACKAGHFRAPNALVPGTAMCMACDGCPTSQCGANGCNSCPNALLNRRVAHPWGLVGMNNAPIMVCRNATGGTTPFKSRTGLLTSSVWPAPEFSNCPKGVADFTINWWEPMQASQLVVAQWKHLAESAVEFQSNETVKVIFDVLNNQRVKVTLQYKDKNTKLPVTKTVWGAFPLRQNRLCIENVNAISYNDAHVGMQMQLYFNVPAAWNKRMLLRLSNEAGATSLTYNSMLNNYKYGKVTVFAKRVGEPRYTLVASRDTGINWRAAELAKLTIHASEEEWPALAAQAGTL